MGHLRFIHSKKSKDPSLRETMILEYIPLVKYIASRIARRLPSHLEIDDLVESGVIGLIDAIDKYNPAKKVTFKTYAEYRIRGAIIDSLRALDWAPRSLRRKMSLLEETAHTISQRKGAPATAAQITEALGIPAQSYYQIRSEHDGVGFLSLESCVWETPQGEVKNLIDMIPDQRQEHPSKSLDHKTLKKLVAQEIAKLPERARTVLYLYYDQEKNMKAIGEILDITESRVSQIHSKALMTLRRRMKFIFAH